MYCKSYSSSSTPGYNPGDNPAYLPLEPGQQGNIWFMNTFVFTPGYNPGNPGYLPLEPGQQGEIL